MTAYVGFLRFFDVVIIQWDDLSRFFSSHMELFLEKTKMDQYQEGRWVLCVHSGGRFCPAAFVEHLLRVASYAGSGHSALIRNTSVSFSVQYNLGTGSLAIRPSSRD